MKRTNVASVALAAGLAVTLSPAVAEAHKAEQSIDITTRFAKAYVTGSGGQQKPTYTIAARVVCPKGLTGVMWVPVYSHTDPTARFTCKGKPQRVVHHAAAAPSTPGTALVPVTVRLVTARGEVSDTQRIRFMTRVMQTV